MKSVTINNKTLLLVEVAKGDVYKYRFVKYKDGWYFSVNINGYLHLVKLPDDKYKFLCKASEATEEITRGIVEGFRIFDARNERRGGTNSSKYVYNNYEDEQVPKLTATESLSSLIRSLGMDENKTIIMSNEEILSKQIKDFKDPCSPATASVEDYAGANQHYINESVVYDAMDAARKDERERTINELVEWMEREKDYWEKNSCPQLPTQNTLSRCIQKAKSLLNNPVKKEGEEQTS